MSRVHHFLVDAEEPRHKKGAQQEPYACIASTHQATCGNGHTIYSLVGVTEIFRTQLHTRGIEQGDVIRDILHFMLQTNRNSVQKK